MFVSDYIMILILIAKIFKSLCIFQAHTHYRGHINLLSLDLSTHTELNKYSFEV